MDGEKEEKDKKGKKRGYEKIKMEEKKGVEGAERIAVQGQRERQNRRKEEKGERRGQKGEWREGEWSEKGRKIWGKGARTQKNKQKDRKREPEYISKMYL